MKTRTAKIFMSGNSQAVRLPKEYRFKADSVYVRKEGSTVMLIPAGGSWEAMENGLKKFPADFMRRRTQPPVQRRKGL
ncbi:MAG: antitoxin [Nitrospinae bacterium]|nr:antitoxin [Nitrospinota bacterium]